MKELAFNRNGQFKIMQLTDLHYTNDDEDDHRTVALTEHLIRLEQPDFIMVSGDTVYGTDNMKNLGKALKPLRDSGIPWSIVLGNHDVEQNGTPRELITRAAAMEGCMVWHDEASGDRYGNHYLEVKGRCGRTAWLIFGLDSGGDNPMKEVGGYDCITPRQIQWYRSCIRRYREQEPDVNALVFQHMALPEIEEVWRYETSIGTRRDGFGCPRVNTGFFSMLLEEGHTSGVFFGHDHTNDFWGRRFGIALGYGRASGYGGYGTEDYPLGARIFILEEGKPGEFETYTRLETGVCVKNPWIHHPLERRDEG